MIRLALLMLPFGVLLTMLSACHPPNYLQYDRPDGRLIVARVHDSSVRRATTTDGRTVDMTGAVMTGSLVCAPRSEPTCFPISTITALETAEAYRPPWWVHVLASPLYPVVLAVEAVEEADRIVTGGPRTLSADWKADSSANPCVRHVRPEANGDWPTDQRIHADLYSRRGELGGRCLIRMSYENRAHWSPARFRVLGLTGQVRARFEAFACARPLPDAEAEAPRVFLPLSILHGVRSHTDWPGELRLILDDPATFAVTDDLRAGCENAGGVATDLEPAIARTREGWPLPENWTP